MCETASNPFGITSPVFTEVPEEHYAHGVLTGISFSKEFDGGFKKWCKMYAPKDIVDDKARQDAFMYYGMKHMYWQLRKESALSDAEYDEFAEVYVINQCEDNRQLMHDDLQRLIALEEELRDDR